MKLHFKKLKLVLSCVPLHFVGWVEPTPGFVGFRCTQSNLHVTDIIAKCETQQRPISEPNHKVSFPIRLDARGQRRCSYETMYEIPAGQNHKPAVG
jgi:hypothetical protein